jgi:SAM-dependent methyltransferase
VKTDARSETMSVTELEQVKRMARASWASGDFPAIARMQLWPVGARIVERVAVAPGERVLDIACGTGNAAIRAAEAGAQVVGVDLTPELFDAARAEAAAAGVDVEWVEGDAEELPFDDSGFDVVLSTFGCMFAPRHEVTARELVRVLRPGGRFGICSWTPEGAVGRSFRAFGKYLPPPPPGMGPPPFLWGSEEHVSGLFADLGVELAFERDTVDPPKFASSDEAIEFMVTKFGPLMMARRLTEADGRWPQLRAELVEQWERNEPGEYLVVTGRKLA